MDFNAMFSSSTPGSVVIYAMASSTINMFGASIPFWLGWIGILLGLFAAFGVAYAVYLAVSAAFNL